ncbi:MAG: LamG domain-containing protein [Planctomycetes bacterium]|nr:LamG domain-containing protein [Planctomycetota bacterium]
MAIDLLHFLSARLRQGLGTAGATLFLCGVTAAQVNGCFETGDLSGWTIEYGTRNSGSTDWGTIQPGQPPATVITATSPLAPCQFVRVPPFEGAYMAQLNDLGGGQHATRISQSFSPTAFDLMGSGVLTGQWAAMLVDFGHEPEDSPGVLGEVFINNVLYGRHEVNARQAASQGWQQVGSCGNDPIWYKRFKPCIDLRHLQTSDVITVRLTVWDCSLGGHGGMAWIDCVKWEHCTAPPTDMVGWWSDMGLRDLAGPPYNDGSQAGIATSRRCTKIGPALVHNTTTYARVPDHADLDFAASQDFSIDLWALPKLRNGRLDPLVSKLCWNSTGFSDGYWFYLDNGNPTLLLASASVFTTHKDTTVQVPLDEWSHLTVTVDRASITPRVRFYLNGDLLAGATPAPLIGSLANANDFHIGGPPIGGSFNDIFSGCTDEIELFRRVLTDAEVAAIAANCKGKCKPCIRSPHPAVGSGSVIGPAWPGHLFDVAVLATEPLQVCALSLRPHGFTGPFQIMVYTTSGSYLGRETNPNAWTLVATGTGTTPGGNPNAAPMVDCQLSAPFTLSPGSHGLAVFVNNPAGSTGLVFTPLPVVSGPLPPYADPDLVLVPNPAVAPGVAARGPFQAVVQAGIWNGTLHYTKASFDPEPAVTFAGAGCPGSRGAPFCQEIVSPAQLGQAASGVFDNLPAPGAVVHVIGLSDRFSPFGPLPLDLGLVGATGCQLRVSPDATTFLLGAPPTNTATWSLGIPNTPSLLDLRFLSQGLVLDPAANAAGLVTTDAVGLLIGR